MARCDHCGNDYDKSFTVSRGGTNRTFDSFECAIASLAPVCSHCGCRIIGHGVEVDGAFYCCVHCAQQAGVTGLRDRADHHAA
jgi:Rieske Fe-S protein